MLPVQYIGPERQPMPQPTPIHCLNCDATYVPGAAYCAACGQSVKDSRLSAIEVVKDALSNVFNLDSRIFHTLRDLYLPSRLTKAYVAGRRKYYLSPARLFLVSLVLLITALLADTDLEDANDTSESLIEDVLKGKQKVLFDSLAVSIAPAADQKALDSISLGLFGNIDADSMWIGQDFNLTLVGMEVKDLRIRKDDVVNLSGDELVEKYDIKPLFNALVIKQYVKMIRDTDSGIRYALKNLTWVLFSLVFFLALALKLLYIRGGYYYVEHLVLLLYWHSPFFLIGAIIFIIDTYTTSDSFLEESLSIIALLSLVSAYICMKKYYQQGWIKTFIKLIALIVVYFFVALLLFVLGALISMLIF